MPKPTAPTPHAAAVTPPAARGVRSKAIALFAVVALALAAGAYFGGRPDTPPAESGTRLLSDCDGTVTDWLLALPEGDDVFFAETQAEIITKADAGVRFHVACANDPARARLLTALRERGWKDDGRVRWYERRGRVWPWTRDLFLAATTARDEPVVFLPEPTQLYRSLGPGGIEGIVQLTAGVGGSRTVPTSARIDGGAVVVDSERIFASTAFADAAVRSGEAQHARQAAARMQAVWGRHVVLLDLRDVHDSEHCDLVLMPAGERRMVVASPALGARLLAEVGGAERAEFAAAYRAIVERAPRGHGIKAGLDLDVLAAMQARNSRPDVQRGYRRIRREIERLGYACVEVPQLGLTPADGGLGTTFSYVNVVIDERGGRRTVYLPSYGLPTLDAYAAHVWRDLGYRVVAIDCLAPAMNGGALHCMSHVFRRRTPRPGHGPQ